MIKPIIDDKNLWQWKFNKLMKVKIIRVKINVVKINGSKN